MGYDDAPFFLGQAAGHYGVPLQAHNPALRKGKQKRYTMEYLPTKTKSYTTKYKHVLSPPELSSIEGKQNDTLWSTCQRKQNHILQSIKMYYLP